MSGAQLSDVLEYWFGSLMSWDRSSMPAQRLLDLWWKGGAAVDAEITREFGPLLARISNQGGVAGLESTEPLEGLALVIVLDQFSRNVYRGTSQAFSFDVYSQPLVRRMVTAGQDVGLLPFERFFLYMPLEHSESAEDQRLGVKLFTALCDEIKDDQQLHAHFLEALDYKIQRAAAVQRFGRFPPRNAILGRVSTPEEIEYLASL
eukprot:gnl/TRDRNA2_/TRDRNA2_136043_c0_seq1.p1 gnl/TRDRNA2_/TRDRNA2_136043_c0~~gnl/TRDRNA2_/TRDRNA2_136043_c0_seq1.p1  ORF type:complete len:205 (+),score=27.19 gnl/TRDRNA2_/TRDRNA2_136043_c0_seq1:156-770(+)